MYRINGGKSAHEMQIYAVTNNCKMLFSFMEANYGSSVAGKAPLILADSIVIIKD